MSDIFREVEEDVRRDRLEKLWKAYGTYAIALVVVGLIAVGGFQVWQRHDAAQREADAAAFVAAQNMKDPREAATAFAALAKTGHGGYAQLARLSQANAMVATGQRADAITLYKSIAEDDKGAIGAVARLRAAWALVDTAPRAELQTLLQPLLTTGGVWRPLSEEILAYADYRSGKPLAAAGAFAKLSTDKDSTDALKNRARAFAAFLNSGGGANHGTVPPSVVPPLPGMTPATTPAAATP